MMRFSDIGLTIKIALVVLLPYTGGIVIASWSAYNAHVNTKLLTDAQISAHKAEEATDIAQDSHSAW